VEDQTTWKGHTFTLLVFTGIVVLSSIFFVLGMLAGRAQAQKLATNTPAVDTLKEDAKPEPKDDRPKFTFYDSLKKEPPAVLEPAPPPKPDPPETKIVAAPETKAARAPETPRVTSKPENVVNYQIGALRKAADAERLLESVKAKGFRAFILSPTSKDDYFRVQVGPFSNTVDAEAVKKKLEAAGFKVYKK
jgi:cell division protein FtsN